MYRTLELNEYLEESDLTLIARIGEEEDDINLQLNCQDICVSKKDLAKIRRWLNVVLKEAN